MSAFRAGLDAYDDWLRERLPDRLVDADLKKKRAAIQSDAFTFLRGTCWWWAETAADLCPSLTAAPVVFALGDAHIENFGLWRDADARLVWGANDFDEAARTPYAFDLVRLAASALLAPGHERTAREIAGAVRDGYREGLAHPGPFVLERDTLWLRGLFTTTDEARVAYWAKLEAAPAATPPASAARALMKAMPAGARDIVQSRRQAGVGSLGRARFAACGALHGAPVAREAKALAPSAWTRVHPGAVILDPLVPACGPWRAPDPCLAVRDGWVLRRLGPNSCKLERDDGAFPIRRRLLRAMGHELANIHAVDAPLRAALQAHVEGWPAAALAKTAARVAKATQAEWRRFSS